GWRQHPGTYAGAYYGHCAGDWKRKVRLGPGSRLLPLASGTRSQRLDSAASRAGAFMSKAWLYQLNEMTKSYGGPPVLRIDRLEILPGETLCLVRPTGTGKSTLFRLLSMLETPSTGRLQFGSHRLNGQAMPLEVQRRVTLVFQRPLLLSGSVQANVEYGLRRQRRGQQPAKVREILDSLGIR